MVKTFLFKSAIALFLTIAGVIAARRRPGLRAPSSSHPHSYSPPDPEMEPGESARTLDEKLPIRQRTHNFEKEDALKRIMPRAPVTVEEDHFPGSSESSGEEEEFPGFLHPVLNKHHQREAETSIETLPPTPRTDYFEGKDVPAMEEEISNLRNLVQSLQDREKYLEMQLFEFQGLKEQDASIRELQNRLKISSTETNLLTLKIESLKAENEKLRSEVSDYCIVTAELELERKNITILKNRMETVYEEAKEKITVLHRRIAELSEKERKDLEDVVQVEQQLKRLTELEDEVKKLQKEKSTLINEKSELISRLSSDHNLNPSVIRSLALVQNSKESKSLEQLIHLEEENDKLIKEIEQLQTDRCAEIEELVYLRWVNACLRYELRNYQIPPGRTIARDLSRCLSLNSEQKVKQLILEYSNSGFIPNQNILTDMSLDDCSSQESSEECLETSHGRQKSKFRKLSKSKFIGKLKKLVLGKSSNAETPSSDGNSEQRASASSCTMDEMARRRSADSISSFSVEKASGSNSSSEMVFHDNDKCADKRKSSLDMHNLRRLNLEGVQERMRARSKSDLGEVYGRKGAISVYDKAFNGSTFNSFLDDKEGNAPEKARLKKFAQVFKNSQGPVDLSSSESLRFE